MSHDTYKMPRRRQGPTQLELACMAKDTAAVRSLLSVGEDPNGGKTGALYEAVKSGCDEAAVLLLYYGASARGKKGFPPLNEAARAGNVVLARRLLEEGAMPNARSQDGTYSLHCAVMSPGGSPMVRLLFEFGCNLNQTDSAGETPLFPAVRSGDTEQISLLCVLGAKAQLLNAARKHAFEYAPTPRVAALSRSLHNGIRRAL